MWPHGLGRGGKTQPQRSNVYINTQVADTGLSSTLPPQASSIGEGGYDGIHGLERGDLSSQDMAVEAGLSISKVQQEEECALQSSAGTWVRFQTRWYCRPCATDTGVGANRSTAVATTISSFPLAYRDPTDHLRICFRAITTTHRSFNRPSSPCEMPEMGVKWWLGGTCALSSWSDPRGCSNGQIWRPGRPTACVMFDLQTNVRQLKPLSLSLTYTNARTVLT